MVCYQFRFFKKKYHQIHFWFFLIFKFWAKVKKTLDLSLPAENQQETACKPTQDRTSSPQWPSVGLPLKVNALTSVVAMKSKPNNFRFSVMPQVAFTPLVLKLSITLTFFFCCSPKRCVRESPQKSRLPSSHIQPFQVPTASRPTPPE